MPWPNFKSAEAGEDEHKTPTKKSSGTWVQEVASKVSKDENEGNDDICGNSTMIVK